MKFTKHTLIIVCAVVGITLVGAKLSLTPTEKHSAYSLREQHYLVQQLQSPEALDEFLAKGTFQGKPLDQVVTNEWAKEFLKPALAELVHPSDSTALVGTALDLVGDTTIAAKIMLLQLLKRNGKEIMCAPYLYKILNTFNRGAQTYLQKKYGVKPWNRAMATWKYIGNYLQGCATMPI